MIYDLQNWNIFYLTSYLLRTISYTGNIKHLILWFTRLLDYSLGDAIVVVGYVNQSAKEAKTHTSNSSHQSRLLSIVIGPDYTEW